MITKKDIISIKLQLHSLLGMWEMRHLLLFHLMIRQTMQLSKLLLSSVNLSTTKDPKKSLAKISISTILSVVQLTKLNFQHRNLRKLSH